MQRLNRGCHESEKLANHPHGAHYHDLAVAVYGEDRLEKSISRTSTMLSYLKSRGKVVALGYGRWALPEYVSQTVEVIGPDDLESDD